MFDSGGSLDCSVFDKIDELSVALQEFSRNFMNPIGNGGGKQDILYFLPGILPIGFDKVIYLFNILLEPVELKHLIGLIQN